MNIQSHKFRRINRQSVEVKPDSRDWIILLSLVLILVLTILSTWAIYTFPTASLQDSVLYTTAPMASGEKDLE